MEQKIFCSKCKKTKRRLGCKLTPDGNICIGCLHDHPEDYCHRCGGRNMGWHTDSETWNKIVREHDQSGGENWRKTEIICPLCLAELDKEKYGKDSHWYITKTGGS